MIRHTGPMVFCERCRHYVPDMRKHIDKVHSVQTKLEGGKNHEI